MEPQVNLRVSYRGETQSFLVSDTAHTTWADVEAMVSTARLFLSRLPALCCSS